MNARNLIFGAMLCVTIASLAYAMDDKRTERQYFTSEAMAALNLPFAEAVLVGDTLYISGAGGLDLETMSVPEGPKEEARLLMESFKSTLAMADMTMDDLVSITIYCPDITLYRDFNEVYRAYFNGDFPARAFIGSGPLLFGMRFEMQGIAVR